MVILRGFLGEFRRSNKVSIDAEFNKIKGLCRCYRGREKNRPAVYFFCAALTAAAPREASGIRIGSSSS